MSVLVRIVAPYVVFASLWIVLSDGALEALVSTPEEFADWSVAKGWLFVFVTAALLTLLLRTELSRRGRAEAELRESREQARRDEALLRAVTEGIPDAIYAKDADGRYVVVNGATCALMGLPRESILGRDDAELFSPEEAARFVAVDRRVMASGAPETFEDVVAGDQGSRIFVTTKGPVRTTEGRVDGVFGVARDVTARRRAAQALRQSEERLQLSLAHSGVGGWELDLVDGVAHRTEAHDRILGFDASRPGWSVDALLERIAPEDRDAAAERLRAAIRDGGDWSFECRVAPANGGDARWVWLAGGHQDVVDGTGRRMVGVVQDITPRKRLEGQLRHLVRGIQALAAARDRDAVVGAAAGAARRLIDADGATVAVLEGDGWRYIAEDAIGPLFVGRSVVNADRICDAVVEERAAVVIKDVARDPGASDAIDRETFVKSLAMVPIGETAPVGVLGVYWAQHHTVAAEELALLETLADATAIALENARSYDELERRVAQRTAELTRAKVRAESADRVKSAFLATMSHELRTPLNSIIGFTSILTQGMAGPLNDEQQRQLGMVQGSARHLLALINDVLDISKIEAGELKVRREPFDLRALIARVVASVRPLATTKDLRLSATIAEELGDAVSDARRVEQILLNLLHNAIKFTERGAVELSAATDGEVVDVRISDTGIGIRPEDLTTLFHPFQQLDTGLARAHEGTGLGLAVSRRLANLLGGTIAVESEWERGTTFTVSLPLHAPAALERPSGPVSTRSQPPDEQPTP